MRYSKDPYWTTARWDRECDACKDPIARGARMFYWPIGKRAHCAACGEASSARFESECFDEEFGSC